jgi:uncharacterized protein (TIGR03118 family)
MRRYLLLPLLLAQACTLSDIQEGLDSVLGNPSHTDNRPGQAKIAQVVRQRNLVSDQEGQADFLDPQLVNAWGLAFNPTGPAWVSNNGTGLSSVFDPNGVLLLEVTVPPPAGGKPPSKPTGQVFNGDAEAFQSDRFIFVTEDGTISGWQPGFDGAAQRRVDNSGGHAVYKGVALAHSGQKPQLYAADFHNAKIDVFDANYAPVASCSAGFKDPDLPENFAPFNIFAAENVLFVAYAQQKLPDKEDDDAGPGRGVVDVFDPDGNLLERLITGDVLNSPWGMALAPSGFGQVPGRLLVGNFGDGHIAAYKLELQGLKLGATFEGFFGDQKGSPLVIDGLWAIAFPPAKGGFDPKDLYFTAGPNDEEHGLFGKLEVPWH